MPRIIRGGPAVLNRTTPVTIQSFLNKINNGQVVCRLREFFGRGDAKGDPLLMC